MSHRRSAASSADPHVSEIANELERLRDDVIRARSRGGEGGATKESLLTLLAEAVREGSDRLPPRLLLTQLQQRFDFESRGNGEMVVRKALYDLAKQARDWYADHPEHRPIVLVTSGGKVETHAKLPDRVDDVATLSALRDVLGSLPAVLRAAVGSPSRALSEIDEEVAHDLFRRRPWNTKHPNLSTSDVVLIERTLYALAGHAIEMAIRNCRGEVIAVEYHPTHTMAAWDEPLLWLEAAYGDYRILNHRPIRRIVMMSKDEQRDLASNPKRWNDWMAHIRRRLYTDEVFVVFDPEPDWQDTLSRDLLIIADSLTLEFEDMSVGTNGSKGTFPFAFKPVHGTVPLKITQTAQAIAAAPPERVFKLESSPDKLDQFAVLCDKLRAHVANAAATV